MTSSDFPPTCLKPYGLRKRTLALRGIAALNPPLESVMNLNLAALPLPLTSEMPSRFQRRHRIGGLDLDNGALRHFREVAESLQSLSPTPGVDDIADVARKLTHQFAGMRRAPCIRLRKRCLTALRAMSTETAWGLDRAKQQRIGLIADYATNQNRLIPDAVPVIGGLDGAVLVELVWPSLRMDLDDYLDFRRLRAEEAALRGLHPRQIDFDRAQWLQSRIAEQAWLAHMRRCGRESYLGRAAPAVFCVH